MNTTPLMVALLTITCAPSGAVPSRADEAAILWACRGEDGSLVYADRELTGDCRPLTRLPEVQRSPGVPEALPQDPPAAPDEPSVPDPPPAPQPGGWRRAEPPGESAIAIRDVTAVPSFNTVLGLAYYRATMTLENTDSTWVAEKVCVNVRFRDRIRLFVDVEEIGCLEDLHPFEPKPLAVSHTGMLPARPGPIDAEAAVEFVTWGR